MAREVLKGIPMPEPNHTVSWVTRGAGLLFTAHGPMLTDGTISTGTIEEQVILALTNLQKTLEAVGSHCNNVLQLIVYLSNPDYIKVLDKVYPEFFSAPYPNRSTVIVERMVVDGMKIKLTATALAE